jgi:hypothetical protein
MRKWLKAYGDSVASITHDEVRVLYRLRRATLVLVTFSSLSSAPSLHGTV